MTVPTRTLLLTGFGPFPGQPYNLSAELVAALANGHRAIPECKVVHDVLATEWATVPDRIRHLHAVYEPEIALHFGVSQTASGFCIERQAHNACCAESDAAGELPPAPYIGRNTPVRLATTLPTGLIVDRLRAGGLPAAVSTDAGRYLCNALFYTSLACAREQPQAKHAGFIHIPARPGPAPLDWDGLVRGASIIVAACLEHVSIPHV